MGGGDGRALAVCWERVDTDVRGEATAVVGGTGYIISDHFCFMEHRLRFKMMLANCTLVLPRFQKASSSARWILMLYEVICYVRTCLL